MNNMEKSGRAHRDLFEYLSSSTPYWFGLFQWEHRHCWQWFHRSSFR